MREGGILTLVNANGAEASGGGDPIALHCVASRSGQLTGDYTIDTAIFA